MEISGASPVRVNGVIAVETSKTTSYDEQRAGPVLTRIHVEENFNGDIEGAGVCEFLQAARSDGSASFMGIERVTGTIAGKKGTFLLQDSGIVSGDTIHGDWLVIPGSGTGQLTGLRGR